MVQRTAEPCENSFASGCTSEAFRSTRVMRIREASEADSNPIESSRKLTQFLQALSRRI